MSARTSSGPASLPAKDGSELEVCADGQQGGYGKQCQFVKFQNGVNSYQLAIHLPAIPRVTGIVKPAQYPFGLWPYRVNVSQIADNGTETPVSWVPGNSGSFSVGLPS